MIETHLTTITLLLNTYCEGSLANSQEIIISFNYKVTRLFVQESRRWPDWV